MSFCFLYPQRCARALNTPQSPKMSAKRKPICYTGVYLKTRPPSPFSLGGSEQQTHAFCIVTLSDPLLDWDEKLAMSCKEEAMVQ